MSTLDRALFLGEAVAAMLSILAVLAGAVLAVGYACTLRPGKKRATATAGGDTLMAVADAVREPTLEPLDAYEPEVADLDRLVRRLARNGGYR